MYISRRYPMKVLHIQRVMNPFLVLWGSKGVSTGVALRQRVQQCLCLLQVSGVKALGEPAVNRCEQVVRFLEPALVLAEATQTHRGPQLQRFRLLTAGNGQGLIKASFSFGLIVSGQPKDDLPSEAVQLCLVEM